MNDEAQLTETVAHELLAAHSARGRQALAAGDDDTARAHLRCITNCGTDPATLKALGPFPFHLAVDERRFTRVAAIAKDVLNDWTADVIRAAQDEVDNPDAIASLPKGVSKNYEGGIERLTPFLRLGIPVPQVLRTGLEWYNSWSFSHYVRQEKDTVKSLTASAGALADALIPLSTKGRGLEPENDALSRHFTFCGFNCADLTEAIVGFEEALAWNPGNDNARTLLLEARSTALNVRAVEITNKSTKTEKPFFDARQQIAKLVELGRQISWPTIPADTSKVTKADCACCGGAATTGRIAIVRSLISRVRPDGGLTIEGLSAFWTEFERFLCPSCQSSRRSIATQRAEAVALCAEAIQLDPTNEPARKNLEQLRRLL